MCAGPGNVFAKGRGALSGGKDAAPGDEGCTWVCLGARKQLTSGTSMQLHPRSTQLKPFRASPSRGAIAVSPTVQQLRPLPGMGAGEPGAGLVLPGGIEVLLSDAESFGGERWTIPLFAPRDPREVRLGLISRSAPPPPLAAPG